MAAVKQVKNLLVLILFYVEIHTINGIRSNIEEEDTPDSHIIYDQRQSGKYNIHVVIKDVAIIEMDQNEIVDQNYNDEEYYYDEDDLTVKPLNIKTTTIAVKPLDSTTDNKTTTPLMQTTISFVESQNEETTFKAPQETLNSTLSVNISKTSHRDSNNNVNDFMTFLTTPRPVVDTKSRSKVEPIFAIEEAFSDSNHHMDDFIYGTQAQTQSKNSNVTNKGSKFFPNSRIYKVKVHRSHRAPKRERCGSYQYRDARGNCRSKRSSSGSILKRLFRMLVTLPFRQDRQQDDD